MAGRRRYHRRVTDAAPTDSSAGDPATDSTAVFAASEVGPAPVSATSGASGESGVAARFSRPQPSDSLSPTERVVPTWTDATAARASALIGGPLGRHAVIGRARIFTPLRVCLAMAIVALICGWLYKAACIQQKPDGNGNIVLDQAGERPWITGCYNDVVPLFSTHGLDHQKLPYSYGVDSSGAPIEYSEYPVVTGYFSWAVSKLSNWYRQLTIKTGLPIPLDVAAYFTIDAIVLGLLYLLAVSCTARIHRRRVWDTAIMCLSPLLIVQAFTNWDLLPIAFTAAAMLAWSKGRFRADRPWSVGWPLLCGLLIGIGTAAKLYPVLLLIPLLVLGLRTGRLQAALVTATTTVLTWLIINVPVALLYSAGWKRFFVLNDQRVPEWNSIYQLFMSLSGSFVFDPPATAGDATPTPTLVNALSLGAFLVAAAAISWFALSVRRRPRFAALVFLIVAAFLLTNKVWSPQYSLWLLPLAALAIPRWRPVLAWQFSEVVVWILLMFSFDRDTSKGLSVYPFDAAALIRDALLIALIVRVIREALRPERDLVRVADDDDPSGGVYDRAPDRIVVPSLPELWRRFRAPTPAVPTDAAEPTEPTPEPLAIGS